MNRGLVAAIVLGVLGVPITGCEEKGVRRDAQGNVRGSGEVVYHYEDGVSVQLRDTYVDGRLELSRWYAPDGSLVFETDWVDESGVGVYLREDGSIRIHMTYVSGSAEGPATYYDEDGNVERVVEFRDGAPVGDEGEPARWADEPEPPVSATEVPLHPLRSVLPGRWIGEQGGVGLEVVESADGGVRIVEPVDESWRTVINNVRWEGDALRYDQYSYLRDRSEPLAHAFEGVRVRTSVRIEDGSDRLLVTVETKHTESAIEMELRRAGGNRLVVVLRTTTAPGGF